MKRKANRCKEREIKKEQENYKKQQKDYTRSKRKAYKKSRTKEKENLKENSQYMELEQSNLDNLDIIKLFESFIVLW